jgi:chemotaxis signal transduction protein
MSEPHHTASGAFVLLQVGERRVALRAEVVSELAPPVKLHAFPHSSPFITGVIVRRGRIVPVYDANSVFTSQNSSAQRFYLITHRRFGKVAELGAIPVNVECELISAEMQPPTSERPAYVAGTIAVGEELLDVLDLEAFIASNSPGENSSENSSLSVQVQS